MKSIKAKQVLDYLTQLEKQGEDLSSISINYRYDYDSDVEKCTSIEQDLFDEETNSRLISITFITKH